jgi:sortase (surface protein transpeptidase)
MARSSSSRHRRRRSTRWWVAAGALLFVAVGCLAVGLTGNPRRLAGPAAFRPAPPSTTATTTPVAPVTPVTLDRSAPTTLNIPAIGVSVSVSALGLNADGTVQVPTDFQQPGWYRLGPSPGQLGSAVILGHVDSYRGPAVFFQLRSLKAGDPVDVTLADGATAHFVVSAVAMYPKVQFPAQQVYGSHGDSELQLVTCGGVFDSHTGSYLSNIVAYSTLVSTTPATDPAAG